MKLSLSFLSVAFIASGAAFSVVSTQNRPTVTALFAQSEAHEPDRRRQVLTTGAAALATLSLSPLVAFAEEEAAPPAPAAPSMSKVVVAGATGQTGSRIYERLLAQGFSTTGGVRNVEKAAKALPSPTALAHLDVVQDSLEELTALLKGQDGLIIACGMNPGKNLLRMSAAAHEVDNLGTIKLMQAAQAAGVSKVVLVSSILTNGRAWGQENSAGFVATNAFGGALDEKLAAEQYLRSSQLDYTIVRPGGLKAKPPTGPLHIYPEDSLNAGEVSRDLVADVCVAALKDPKASNKVLEIIEDEGVPPKVFNGLVM
mmetsp:Transcript_37542/g.77899  ORF Transcript_37542/g.77899 Transcript_37542/m.77899 type:complete len:314 (-) Transcript_37542:175-1116(-)